MFSLKIITGCHSTNVVNLELLWESELRFLYPYLDNMYILPIYYLHATLDGQQ